MKTEVCVTCQKPKAHLTCAQCQGSICKTCAQFVDEDSVEFADELPQDIVHASFCIPCFDRTVASELNRHQDIVDRAKNLTIFTKSQTKETRLLSRVEKPIVVTNGIDRDQTLLRLAFLAAKAGFNALIDVDIKSEKIRNAGYQKSAWQGSGVPLNYEEKKAKWR